MTQSKINIMGNYEDLCEKVTREILILSNEKLVTQERFTIVLSGGLTPKGIYQCMSSPVYQEKFHWERMHFFWSDERWVPPEDSQSNFRMVFESLLTRIKIPPENIHPIQTKDCGIQTAVNLYEESIINFFELKKGDFPYFDLILLGVGPDGHTSFIFPGNQALLVKDSLVTMVSQKDIAEERITLTLPVINHAQMILFVVSGIEKADIVAEVLENKTRNTLPASQINPSHGSLQWFLDMEAASKLVIVKRMLPKRIGIAADHGGYQLKEQLAQMLRNAAYEVTDFGNQQLNPDDDYPDFVAPLAFAISKSEIDCGVAICGSGVGACIVANKVPGVRACLIHEEFSARQGVEDDGMNVICLGSHVLELATAWKLVMIFLSSQFDGAQRHQRRLIKMAVLEHQESSG